jgi:hypothetical protein
VVEAGEKIRNPKAEPLLLNLAHDLNPDRSQAIENGHEQDQEQEQDQERERKQKPIEIRSGHG